MLTLTVTAIWLRSLHHESLLERPCSRLSIMESDRLCRCPAQAQEQEQRADRHRGAGLREREDSDADSSRYTDTDYSDSEEDSLSAAADVPVTRDAPGNEPDGRRRGGPGSIASTYWRPERTDRKNLLTVVDEQCALSCSGILL